MNTPTTRLCFLPVVFLLLFTTAFAQQKAPEYLPHTLVIKYADRQTMAELRLKGNTDPKSNIRSFLSTFGASPPQPIWTPSAGSALENRTKSPSQQREIKSAVAELERIHTVQYAADVDAEWLAAKVTRLPGVEYAEPKYLRFTQYQPNDPVTNDYEDFHRFYEAWDVTQGTSEVVIAIIDTGVDYNHSDLDDKLWINEDEIPDNGEDDDGNGKVDDVIGWDFWESGSPPGPFEEDNDPIMDENVHGTHVAGIAAAETDNDTGISGTGFNSIYMAVKAGGAPDDPETIGFGFEGMIYAAENGAGIINCSWGGGGYSEAENEIVEYVTSLGSVVVAAAGNEGNSNVLFPAAYQDVIAVGSVETSNSVSSFSNYGYNLDVLATGSNVQSTVENDEIAPLSGTSMSTPVVSGLAALLRSEHPGWSPKRIATQIRATSVPLDNSSQLGKGKIDAYSALATDMPGIEIHSVSFVNQNGNKLSFEEQGSMEISLVNYGASTSSLNLSASSLSGTGIELSDPASQPGAMATGDTVQVSIPIRIEENFDLDQIPTVRIDFSDSPNNYSDFGVAQYDDLLYDIMAENRVKMSISADGTIGFTNPLTGSGGIGFIPRQMTGNEYEDGDNLLFEGGLMLEMNGNMYDAVRSANGNLSRDFRPQSTFRLQEPGEQADAEGTTRFVSDTINNIFANINLTSFAYSDPELSNVVMLLYEIENPSTTQKLQNIYAGLFNDWDIGASADNNSVNYSQQDSILYVYDNPQSSQPIVAVASVGPLSSALAIENPAEGTGTDFGIYDGYSDEEKKLSLKAGTQKTAATNSDVSAVVASGPYTLDPYATVRVGFIYAFGDNLNELRSQIAQARSRFPAEVSGAGLILPDRVPDITQFFQNYPNPFNPSTNIRVDLAQRSHVNISVYNVIGRKVAEIVDHELEPNIHVFKFSGRGLSSGVYFARLKTETQTKTIKMLLVK